jgi:hypothetical protein
MHHIGTHQVGSEEKIKRKRIKELSKRTTSRSQRAKSGLVRQPDNRRIGFIFFSSWPVVSPYSILGPQRLSITAQFGSFFFSS